MNERYCYYCMEPCDAQDRLCTHCHKPRNYEAPVHHLKPGTLLREKYMVGKALGEGGFGITYVGRDTTLDMRIAVKEYYPNGYSNRNHNVTNEVTLTQNGGNQDFEAEMQRFLREARMLAKFSDEPGIVGVRDFFRENGTAYIVMEYLDGITLKEYLRQNGVIPAAQLLDMIGPVLLSLDRIHKENMIHRDISPDNIMVLKNGSLKLLDFGAAREVKGDKSLSVVLKPGYAPEEQYRTKGDQGPWTDVYAISATIYKCITGVTPDESLERVYDDGLQPPTKLGAALDLKQEAALLQGLCVRARDRIQSVAELWQGLQAVTDTPPVQSVQIQRQPEEEDTKTVFQPVPEESEDPKTVYQPVSPTPLAEVKSLEIPVAVKETAPEEKPESPAVPEETPVQPDEPSVKEAEIAEPVRQEVTKQKSRKWMFLAGGGLAAVILLVVLLIGLGNRGGKVEVATVPGNSSYMLDAAGQIADTDRELGFKNGMICKPGQNGGYVLYNAEGKDTTGKTFEAVECLGGDLYIVREASDAVNSVGLLTGDGEYLIQGDAALIRWPYSWNGDMCRYVLAYYADSETTDAESALVYYTENGSYTTQVSDSVPYTGSIKVYDVEQKRFVPGFPALEEVGVLQVCGNSLLINNASGGTSLYNAAGECLLELPSQTNYVGDGIFVNYADGTYRVYDENGSQTFSANKSVAIVGNSSYVMISTDGRYTVMDAYGNAVLPEAYEMVTDVYGDLFKVKEGGKYGLVKLDGTVLVPCQYDTIESVIPGYGYMSRGDDYYLYGPEGVIATQLTYSGTKLVAVDKENRYYVLNSRGYDLQLGTDHYDVLEPGLAAIRSKTTGLYGVYDLFTGEQLLSDQYEQVSSSNGKVYAFRNGTWEIYEVTFS